jgi:hypothetical protein
MPEPILNLQLAQAQRLHTEATEAHQDAAKALQNITSVIANKQNQRAAITTARLAGTATAQDAAEYSAIAGDLEVLENMRADAAQVLAQAAQTMRVASNALNAQVSNQQRVSQEADYLALHAATEQAEAAFIKALALTCRAGRVLGHVAIAQSYKFGTDLNRVTLHRVAPAVVE